MPNKHIFLLLSMVGSLFAQGPIDEPFFLPEEITTARQITEQIQLAEANGRGIAGQIVAYETGIAALTMNWTRAVVLQQPEDADRMDQEIEEARSQHQGLLPELVQKNSEIPNYTYRFLPFRESYSGILSVTAITVIRWQSLITPQVDPDGYLRQRLDAVFRELQLVIDLIRDTTR